MKLPVTLAHRDTSLDLEGLARLDAARTFLDYVLSGHVQPQPWTSAARRLMERAEWYFERAA